MANGDGLFSDASILGDVGAAFDAVGGGDILSGLGSDVGGITGWSDATSVAAGALQGTLPGIFSSGAAPAMGAGGFSGTSPYVGTAGVIPMVAGMGRSMAARFPQLWNAIMSWRAKGVSLTVEKLWSMLGRFGPQMLIAAGILSAGALTELILHHASHKRRRMNVLNGKALRRSTRRLLGFERRACRIQEALGRTVSRAHRGTRRRHCLRCKSNPCKC